MGAGAGRGDMHWGDWEAHFPDLSAAAPEALARMDCAGQPTLVIGPMAAASAALSEVGAEVWTYAVDAAAYVPRCPRLLLGALPWLHQHPRLLLAGAPAFTRVFCGAGAWRWLDGAEAGAAFVAGLARITAPGGVLGLVLPQAAGAAPTPRRVGADGAVVVVSQAVDGLRWEWRFVEGMPARVDRGHCPGAARWQQVLRGEGFEIIEAVELAPEGLFFLKCCRVSCL